MRLINASLLDRPGNWEIAIANGLVTELRPMEAGRPSTSTDIDLGGKLVHRPFIDIHLHLDKAYQSDTAPNRSGTLAEAIELGRAYKAGMDETQVFQKVLRGAREALLHGTTRIRTHVDVDPASRLAGVIGALQAKSALRGLVDVQIVAFPQEGITNQPGVVDLLREAIRLGCTAVGGIPARDPDPHEHIRQVFALAQELDVPIDMHVDESDNPADLTLAVVARETQRTGYAGRVTAGHCCSLDAQEPELRHEVIERVAEAGVHVVTLPSTNLYLQGRADQVRVRRGVAPVKELLANGVNVTFGSDNIRDPFNPFGNANMLEGALLLAHAAHMGGTEELAEIFTMGTRRAAAVWESRSLTACSYEVAPGQPADLVVFSARTPQEVIVAQAPPVMVFVGGRQLVQRADSLYLSERFPTH